MSTELEISLYEEYPGDPQPGPQSISINLTTDDPKIRKRFAAMAREMEENADALLNLLTETPNGFDTASLGGSDD